MLPLKGRIFVAIAFAVVFACFFSAPLLVNLQASGQYEARQRELYYRFDATRPGRGVLDYPGNPVGDVAKSYAMILLAELTRSEEKRLNELPALFEVAGNWLLEHPNTDDGNNVGWGLPVAWDAFGDGSENPANAIYSISTAIVVDGLLTWSEERPDAPKDKIAQLVAKALDGFVAAPSTPDGLFPYSLQASDRPYDTFNSAAYLAGQMQRYGTLVGDDRYTEAADRTIASLIRNHRVSTQGHWYWTYSLQEARSNDLPHATYIVKGISDYARFGGRLADSLDLPATLGLLREYLLEVPTGATEIRAWPAFEADVTLPARLYDLGIALSAACNEPGLRDLIDPLLGVVASYQSDLGYLKYPVGTEGMEPIVVNEYEAYLWYGISECAKI
ncbi:MAG: hypothetical protein KKF33_10115 [Alphaproteobacteria bacterium]|nr:hypothetical protein [Alphaproteobacteria bacterium]